MLVLPTQPRLITVAEYFRERLAVFMAAGHLKRGTSGHLLRNSGGHLVNDCAPPFDPCTYCISAPAPDPATLPTAVAIQNYDNGIFDFAPCDYDDPALPLWDGIFRDPVLDGGDIFYEGTRGRVKGAGGVGWNASDYPYAFLTFDHFCGLWGIFIGGADDAWNGARVGPGPLGTYAFCGVCAGGPPSVTLI